MGAEIALGSGRQGGEHDVEHTRARVRVQDGIHGGARDHTLAVALGFHDARAGIEPGVTARSPRER